MMLRESFFGLTRAPLELHLKLDGRVAVVPDEVVVDVGVFVLEVGDWVDEDLVLDEDDVDLVLDEDIVVVTLWHWLYQSLI